jgi:hypothetical protein
LFLLILFGLATAFFSLKIQAQPRIPQLPVVVRDDSKLDYGDRWEGEALTIKLPIQNRSGQPVHITEFKTSCSCLSVEPKEVRLGAGEDAAIQLALNPWLGPGSGYTDNDQSITVGGYDKDGFQVLTTVIRGRRKRILDVNSAVISFPEQLWHQKVQTSHTIRIRPKVRVSGLRAAPHDEIKSVVKVVPDGYELVAQVAPKDPGRFTHKVRLEALAEDGVVIGIRELLIDEVVQELVVAMPSSKNFGARSIGEVASVEVRLVSAQGQPVSVARVLPSEVTKARQTDDSTTYVIEMKIGPKHNSGQVDFLVEGAGRARLVVKVTVSAYGIE